MPLAIERTKLDMIVAAVAPRIFGIGALEIYDHQDDEAVARPDFTVNSDGIAVIPIYGTLVSKTAGVDAVSGPGIRCGMDRAVLRARDRCESLSRNSATASSGSGRRRQRGRQTEQQAGEQGDSGGEEQQVQVGLAPRSRCAQTRGRWP